MINKIKKYFKTLLEHPKELNNPSLSKTLKNLELFDDIWIEKDGKIEKAWVWEITKYTVTVVFYNSRETLKIHYKRPLDTSVFKDQNITVYLDYEAVSCLY